jgi:hypothetical protein
MNVRVVALLGLAAALLALWVANCSGPRPAVSDVRLVPPAGEGAPYRVEALVRNTGRGHGEVVVEVRLRDASSGVVIQKEEQVALDAGETARVISEIPAPRGSYTPEVNAVYPPS